MEDHRRGDDAGTERRALVVRFHTSNMDKFIQARRIFQRQGINVTHFRDDKMRDSYQYQEKYELGRGPEFLKLALEEIKNRIGANSLFFIEDTSVRIDALSESHRDAPGLAVKEWFGDITFEELDKQLRAFGNNRQATVYSDVALYVPGLENPVYVVGETKGNVAESPQSLEKNNEYPWLSPHTFNGWFIPDGSTKRLGEMSFQESLQFDFRAKSFRELAGRLQEYFAIANLPPRSYHLIRPKASATQLSLFENFPIIVIGRTCAGKTTFGRYLAEVHGYAHIEASKAMRCVARKVGIFGADGFHTAQKVLGAHGADVVAKFVVDSYGFELAEKAVVTGFRTIEEIIYVRHFHPRCTVVFISAGEKARFDRHLVRGRLDTIATIGDFREHDKKQVMFGLLGRGQDLSDVIVENEGSFDELYSRIDSIVSRDYRNSSGIKLVGPGLLVAKTSRLYRCLFALSGFEMPVSPSELSDEMNVNRGVDVPEVSARHVNWILLCQPELAERLDFEGRIRYRISAAGRAYLRAIGSTGF